MIINNEKKTKYKLRNLSIGVVSFMCGFTILFGSFANVNAQVPASSTVKVIDKSKWPSMIADKSNEGKPLKPGTSFFGGPSEDEGEPAPIKLVLHPVLDVLGEMGYKVANPFLLSSDEKAHIIQVIENANPAFFDGDTNNAREIIITDDGKVKFKNSESNSIVVDDVTYNIGEEINRFSTLAQRDSTDHNAFKEVPISPLLDYKFPVSTAMVNVEEDPLKPGKKLFLDLSKYGGDKEKAAEEIMDTNFVDLPPELRDLKFAVLNSLVEKLKEEGFNSRYQNFSPRNPNGIDMWKTDNGIVPGNNNATIFLDTSNKVGFALNVGYYNKEGNMPTRRGTPEHFTEWNEGLGNGPSINADIYELLVNYSADITESEAYKYPPNVKPEGAIYSPNSSPEEKKAAIENAVTLPENTPSGVTKTILGNIPATEGDSRVNILVEYPDGSYKEIEVPVTVKVFDSEKYTPNTTPVTYAQGTSEDERRTAVLNGVTGVTTPAGGTITGKELVGTTPDTVGNNQSATVKVTYNDGSSENVNVTVNVTVSNKEATVQPLGGWTNPRFTILPDNLGTSPAPNQGAGKVIEYTTDQWNASNNYNDFGWKPIGTKVGINKDGLNGLGVATPNGEGTLDSNKLNYQDGFIPNSQRETNYNNSLILANYADRDSYKGVYRLVNVRGEKELSWKSSYSAYNVYNNPYTDEFDVKFYDNETNSLLDTKHINTREISDATGVLMIPSGTNVIKVELVPSYNSINSWNFLNQYGYGTKDRYNVLINGFELYKTSKMIDALPENEKIQIFRNGTTGTYNFTVKNASPQESGTNGGAQISPYLTANQNGAPLEWSKTGVEVKFEDKLPSAAVSDNKPTLFANGMNNQTSEFTSNSTKKLELKTIDLTKTELDRPQVINVDAYKLNYSTQAKTYRNTFNVNKYIRREYTANDTPYHQDVVANNEEAATSYGNQLTNKLVSPLATGRSIIILMDKTALTEVVNAEKAKTLNQADYTKEAWEKYQEALAKAKAILAEDESLDNLKVDTATKLAAMADQTAINTLARELPTMLVKAPAIAGGSNGSITVTPAEETVKVTVKYKDGDKDITVEVTKTENPKETPDAQPTYSWNITGVDTVEGDNPTVHTTDAPTGVSIDNNSGVVTIQNANVSDGTPIISQDTNASNNNSKETTATKPNAPTITATNNSTVTITPPSDENVKTISVSYTDSQGVVQSVTARKSEQNTWSLSGNAPEITINEADGVVTIPNSLINARTSVTAKSTGENNLESSSATHSITDAQKYEPTVTAGALSVNKDVVASEDGKQKVTADLLGKVEIPQGATLANQDGKVLTGTLPTSVGEHKVPVRVTYQDGTSDTVNVTLTITETQAQKDTALTATGVSYKSNADSVTRENAIKNAISTTTEGVEIQSKTIKGQIPTDYTNGQPVNVAVTVTYTDGSTKDINVPVTVLQTDAQKYEPTVTAGALSVNKDAVADEKGKEKVTADLLDKVTVPQGANLANQDGKVLTGELPTAVGTHTVPVRVTYADGTSDTVNVTLTITSDEVAPPVVTVNPPSVIAQNDGSVTITPQGDNADTIKVGFKDNADDTSISITANKNDQEKWSLESEFKGVEIDANSGVITINSGVAKAGTEVTAVAEKNGIKSATATATVKDSKNPVKPPVIEQANGSVTITPQGDVNKIDISFTDKNDKEVQVVAEKNVQGNWNLKNQVDGVSINQDTGVVTLSSGTAKVGSEVKAKESKDGTESGEAKVTVIDSNKPVKPGPGPVKPQEPDSSDKDERSKRHEKTEKHEVVKKEKVKDNGVRYLDGRVKITPVGIDDNNKFVYKRILYIKGYPDNTVRPDNDLTRAEVAMILARLDGLELDDNEYPNFNDTKTDAWYNAAINAVVKKGYMKGYPDSKFYPNKKITRAELANIMVNVYSASGNELKNFSDIKSHWAEDAIKKASESGFVSGYEDGTFKPDKFITRAESVKMFNLLYLYKLSAGNILKIEESKNFKDFKDNEKKDWYYDDIVESTNDYYFTLDNKGVNLSNIGDETNINHISVSTDDINVIKDGYGSIVRFLNNGSTK